MLLETMTWTWLALVALLTSVVSLYYYAGIIRVMYFDRSKEDAPGLTVDTDEKRFGWRGRCHPATR